MAVGWLGIMGVVVEGVGLAVAGWGIADTWRHHGKEGFFNPVQRQWAVVSYRVRRVLLTPFGRTPKVAQHSGSAKGLGFVLSLGKGRGYASWVPTDPDRDIADNLALLDQQGSALHATLHQISAQQDERTRKVEASIKELSDRLDQEDQRTEALEARVHTDGLRVEAVGLGLVGVGLILQGVAAAL